MTATHIPRQQTLSNRSLLGPDNTLVLPLLTCSLLVVDGEGHVLLLHQLRLGHRIVLNREKYVYM